MASTQIKKPQSSFLKPFKRFFRRFHLIIFFVFMVSCMAASVLLINQTLKESSSQNYNSTISAGSIDRTTLERVQSLHSSSEPAPAPTLPAGRVNPFAE